MPTFIHQRGSLECDVVDDDYDDVLDHLQRASQAGKGFLGLDGLDGERQAFNISLIAKITESDE